MHKNHKKINKFYLIIFIVWIALWAHFIIRNLVRKGYINHYKILLSRDVDGKRSYAYGDQLYEFLKYCKSSMPEGSTYDIIGIIEGSIDQRRIAYYLYPDLCAKDAKYLLIFDGGKYMLKRKKEWN